MARSKQKNEDRLLRWSKHVPASDVLDPLGLALRGSTRLASLLLFCITSITPRARYFSFIPWCISDYQAHEKGSPQALGLKHAIRIREVALTYGCVAHHGGKACEGGGLVGSTAATKWLAEHDGTADLKRLPFAKNPALNAYLNSLVNLGCFESQQERIETEEEIEDAELTFDQIELSELGRDLASAYGTSIGGTGFFNRLTGPNRTCSVDGLKQIGQRGGLCELTGPGSQDRELLKSVFFANRGFRDKSHHRRNRTLTLILELSRQFSALGSVLDEGSFGYAVYFGRLPGQQGSNAVSMPLPLQDISNRWRMFYFHHFMSVALEGMFSWLVTNLNDRGLSGSSLPDMVAQLQSVLVSRALVETFGLDTSLSLNSTPANLFDSLLSNSPPRLAGDWAMSLDEAVSVDHPLVEPVLEAAIRGGEHLRSPAGLAIPAILFGLALARFRRWESTEFGAWLASDAVVKDPYLDLLPSTVSLSLDRHLGEWWSLPWPKLMEYVLSRFVVQQHQSMSYEKTAQGERCLLQVDGQRIVSDGPYEKIGLGNPRLRSAQRILADLALIETDADGVTHLTDEGAFVLHEELGEGDQA